MITTIRLLTLAIIMPSLEIGLPFELEGPIDSDTQVPVCLKLWPIQGLVNRNPELDCQPLSLVIIKSSICKYAFRQV